MGVLKFRISKENIRKNLRLRKGCFKAIPLDIPYAIWELLTSYCNLNF